MNIADVTPGMRVRLTRAYRTQLKVEGAIERLVSERSAGKVTEICSVWGAVEYESDDGTRHIVLADRLERDMSRDETVRIKRAAL